MGHGIFRDYLRLAQVDYNFARISCEGFNIIQKREPISMNGGNDFQGNAFAEIESLYLDGCFQK